MQCSKSIRTGVLMAMGILAISANPASSQAVKYPVDTISAVTYSSVGGGTDVFLREMSKFLGPIMGANVVVENVTGGSGARAMAKIATSEPDGSIVLGTTITIINTSVIHRPQYQWDDMDMVLMYAIDPAVAYVSADSPFKNLQDIIDYAKANPGELKFGLPNPTAMDRWVIEQLKKKIPGFDANAVSFEGGGDLMLSVMNKTIDIANGEPSELRGQIQGGKIRAIAAWTDDRLEVMPDVPTAKEQGVDLVVRKFRGIAGPKGMPESVIDSWWEAMHELVKVPEFKSWLDRGGVMINLKDQAEYTQFMQDLAQSQEEFFTEIGLIK